MQKLQCSVRKESTTHLNASGFSYNLLTRYKESGWLKSFGRRAYVLPGDRVEWPGAFYALQAQLALNVNPGGKTALELKGYGHYLSPEQRKIFLYGQPGLGLTANWTGSTRSPCREKRKGQAIEGHGFFQTGGVAPPGSSVDPG